MQLTERRTSVLDRCSAGLSRRLQHDQHSAAGCGSRSSAFFSLQAPSLQAQRRQRRAEQQICSATALQPQRSVRHQQQAEAQLQSAAASPATVLQPQRQPTATVPDEGRDQRLRDREERSVLECFLRLGLPS